MDFEKAGDGKEAGYEVADEDTKRLQQLGYKQELKRDMNLLKSVSLSLGLMCFLLVGGVYGIGLANGGPVVIVWGWVICSVMTFFVVLSLAEISSAFPTAGGPYYWSGSLSGSLGPLPSWICGWVATVSWMGSIASLEFQMVLCIQAVVQMAKGPEEFYEFDKYQKFGVFVACTFVHCVFNCLGTQLLGGMAILSLVWSVAGLFAIVIGLPIAAPTTQTANWVFTTFWANEFYGLPAGWTFCVGLLMSMFALGGYDVASHIAEETKDAPWTVPRAMIISYVATCAGGFALALAFTFCIQDPGYMLGPESITGGYLPIGNLFWQIFYKDGSGSSAGAIAYTMIILGGVNWSAMFIVSASLRMVYAFARDNGLPFSKLFCAVNPTVNLPLGAVVLSFVGAVAFGSTILGSAVAFNATVSICVIGNYLAYGVPILLRVTVSRDTFTPAKDFSFMGKWTILVGWISIGWILFLSVVFSLPQVLPVTGQNLNYAPVALGAMVIVCVALWYADARHWYQGPRKVHDLYG